MTRYWAQFAKTGAPGVAGGVNWPAYTEANDRVLEFSNYGLRVVKNFRKPQLDFTEAHAGPTPWR